MKLLFITVNFPDAHCGIGEYSYYLSNELVKDNFEVFILTSDNKEIRQNKDYKVLPKIKKWNISALPIILSEIKNIKPDFVCLQYTPYVFNRIGIPFWIVFLALLIKINNFKFIVTFHEVAIMAYFNPRYLVISFLQSFIAYLLALLSFKIIITAKYRSQYFLLLEKKIIQIPVGSNITPFKISDEEKGKLRATLNANKKIILSSFGTLSPYRKHNLVLRAIKNISTKYNFNNFCVLFIGSQNEKFKSLIKKEIAKLNLSSYVKFTDYLSNEDVFRYLSISDIFFLLNTEGTLGITTKSGSIAAAYAAGLPIISTYGPDKSFFKNGENVFFAKSHSIEDLEVALWKLINDTGLRSKLSVGAAQTYKGELTWQVIASKYKEGLSFQKQFYYMSMNDKKIKISISCIGRSHAFHLAEELDKRGYLHRFLTTYHSQKRGFLPEFRKDSEIIDPSKVITNIFPALIHKIPEKIPFISRLGNWVYYSDEDFDRWVSKQVDECDIFFAWSDTALHTLRRAKKYGAVTIVERPASHIYHQKIILEEEYKKYGIKVSPVDDRMLAKELSEYEEADYVSVPSEYAKQSFISQGINPNKLICVPYGVDLSVFKPAPKNDDVFRIVFAGIIHPRKGVQYLLEAFSKLRLDNSELLLIGSLAPEGKQFLEKYEGLYKYIGYVPHQVLYKYLSQGSVFGFPSIDEGMAIVQIQAMACGLPVICTYNSGGSDIVRDGMDGYIVSVRDVGALKEKITYLYENQDICKKVGESALNRVSGSYSWNDYGDRMTSEFLRVLRKE